MSAPELSRPFDPRRLGSQPVRLEANEVERKALARRFTVLRIERLEAEVSLDGAADGIDARGRLSAEIVQSCAISGEELPVVIDEPIELRFVPELKVEGEEVELEPEDLDIVPFEGGTFDLGEAVAQTLGLAINPYLVGPDAERVRQESGLLDEAAAGPFAALAALKKP